jgi:outer membrane receptor protein involved in Fe transport
MKKIFIALFILFLFFSPAFSQKNNLQILRGTVLDLIGLPIKEAKIEAVSNSGMVSSCQTDEQGKFACELKNKESFVLTVQAEGFSILRQTFGSSQDFSEELVFTLSPIPLREEVVTTANLIETRLSETPASVVSLSKQEIQTTAAPTIDDTLRQVPGFSLFRRSGSRTSNPTTQGVSLRGVGASGAGRSSVLFDNIPLNDSFGGWVQWSRIPPISVERIEVLRGGASSLYGNDSLSGTVNIITRQARKKFDFSAEIYGGSQDTFSPSAFLGFNLKDWTIDLNAAHFQSEGYMDIEENIRGIADVPSSSRNTNFSGRIERRFADKGSVFGKFSYFGEERSNGTIVQRNQTQIRKFAFGGSLLVQSPKSKVQSPKLSWQFYGGTQGFDQSFSAVSDDRNSENLVRIQRVPAQDFGFSSQFTTVVGENQTFVVGFEAKEVRGASNETGFFGGRATSEIGSGGRERTYSIFVQDFVRIGSRVVLVGSGRYDSWKNFGALSSVRSLSTNVVTTTVFPDRSENAFSPNGSILFQATDKLSFHALASRSFRAPTLNELYRGFRVGDVITNPNENLRAEKATNFEAGTSFGKGSFYLRGNFFYTEISDPIANVTLSVSNSIVRQRQNIGKTRATGLEIEAETRIKNFNFSAGYLLSDSRVLEFSANPVLESFRIPQVAKHQFTFQTRYANKNGWSLALQGRALGEQFDDDLNQFRLEPFFQLDAFGAKRFREKFQIFVGIENIFNSRYSIGKTPIRTVSSPINGRIGIRWN